MKKQQIITLSSLAAAFVLLLTLSLLGKFTWGWFDEDNRTPHIQPDLEAGESYLYYGSGENRVEAKNTVLLYPQIESSQMLSIRIKNKNGENFCFIQTTEGGRSYFLLAKCDEKGNWDQEDVYAPPITDVMSSFSYAGLYDEVSKVLKMVSSVGIPVITERIRPDEGGELTEEFLSRYGLGKDASYFEIIPYAYDPATGRHLYTPLNATGDDLGAVIRYSPDDKKYYYVGEDGKNGEEYPYDISTLTFAADTNNVRRVYVGDRTVDDTGCYLHLEGRDVVYTTTDTNLSTTVERGLGYYIAPQLVIKSESDYAFRLTPGFMIENGEFVNAFGTVIPEGATVGVTTETRYHQESNGGESYLEKSLFNMIDLKNPGTLSPFRDALVGRRVGDVLDVLVPRMAFARVGETVSYNIHRIRGILKNGEYSEETGDVLTGDEKIVVAYSVEGSYAPGGALQTFYGYIDLASETTPDALKEKLVGLSVGDTCGIDYIRKYDGINDTILNYTYEIQSINAVYDKNGTKVKTANYGTTVEFSYRLFEGDEHVSTATMTLRIPEKGEGEGQFDNEDTWLDMSGSSIVENRDKIAYIMKNLASGLIGKDMGDKVNTENMSTLVISVPFAVEVLYDYDLYENTKVDYAIGYDEEISFKFKNERDYFYGSSLYEINMDSNKSVYALNSETAEAVVALFQDLKGDETVALGINYETILKYKLYAYRMQYTMPFNCYQREVNGKDYYYSKYQVTFDLYVSDVQEDGSRYVASTQYDTIVRVKDGSTFDFLDYSFAAKWVQNNIMQASYTNLRRMVFDLNFSEDSGEDFNKIWAFDLTLDPAYAKGGVTGEGDNLYPDDEDISRLYAALVDCGAHSTPLSYGQLNALLQYETVEYNPKVTSYKTMAGKLAQVVAENVAYYTSLKNEKRQNLDTIFGDRLSSNALDYTGVYYFKDLLRALNETCYAGEMEKEIPTMTAEERARLDEMLENEDYTMRLALTLVDYNDSASRERGFTFTFYNYGMNSLVVVRDEETGAEAADFYVRSREVIRLAQMVVSLANGNPINPDHY